PAWLALVREGGAYGPPLVGAILDLPARCVVQELLDPLDADLFGVDQLADAAKPLDVIFRIQPVPALARGQDQSVLLVEPQCLRRGADKLCGYPHGIERRVLVF